MDSFGRLPSDILKEIKFLYQLPSIKLYRGTRPQFIITMNGIKITIDTKYIYITVANLTNFIRCIDENQPSCFNIIELTDHLIIFEDADQHVTIKIPSTSETRQLLKTALLDWLMYLEPEVKHKPLW